MAIVRISDATDTIRLPWYFLPHKAAMQTVSTNSLQLVNGAGSFSASNLSGTTPGSATVFNLLGTSPQMPANTLPRPGDNFAVVDLRAAGIRFVPNGAGAGLDVIQFAMNTFGERSHPNYPAEFDVFMDIDGDGNDDYVAYTGESGGFAVSGQNVTNLFRLATSTAITRFFTSADLNSSNVVLNILRNDLLTASSTPVSAGARIRLTFCSGDNYYTGLLTDCIGPVYYTLDTPRFTPSLSSFIIPPLAGGALGVTHNPAGNAASPSHAGFLLLYGDARSGKGSRDRHDLALTATATCSLQIVHHSSQTDRTRTPARSAPADWSSRSHRRRSVCRRPPPDTRSRRRPGRLAP